MASFVLHGVLWGVGQSVNVYSGYGQVDPSTPIGPVVTTGTVAGDNSVPITGLDEDTAYIALASLSGQPLPVRFRTEPPPTGPEVVDARLGALEAAVPLKADEAALSAHTVDTTTVHGIADTAALETQTGAAAKVATHEADTTSVHGIADTAALETQSGAAAKVATHEADTTSVHGIANTSALALTADSRFPTSGEKSALAGSQGTPGAGNVFVTNVDARLVYISVKAPPYNAVGDGTTDDRAAIQAAIDAAATTHGVVYLPAAYTPSATR
jgi:hypothetical protein